jgi:hypothetical protein
MPEEVELITETRAAYRGILRPGTPADRVALVKSWAPLLERERATWLDWEWPWQTFGTSDLHLEGLNPDWLVIADELESEASGELFGVLVTTGPATARQAGVEELLGPDARLLWVDLQRAAQATCEGCRATAHVRGGGSKPRPRPRRKDWPPCRGAERGRVYRLGHALRRQR